MTKNWTSSAAVPIPLHVSLFLFSLSLLFGASKNKKPRNKGERRHSFLLFSLFHSKHRDVVIAISPLVRFIHLAPRRGGSFLFLFPSSFFSFHFPSSFDLSSSFFPRLFALFCFLFFFVFFVIWFYLRFCPFSFSFWIFFFSLFSLSFSLLFIFFPFVHVSWFGRRYPSYTGSLSVLALFLFFVG